MKSNAGVLARYWIHDLLQAGISYSRLSQRLQLSPSTIQKIVKNLRTPRLKTLLALAHYYTTIFTTPMLYGNAVNVYYLNHQATITVTLTLTAQLLRHEPLR